MFLLGDKLFLCFLVINQGFVVSSIKCFSGIIYQDGDDGPRLLKELPCPESQQSCFAIHAHATIYNRQVEIFTGSCQSSCHGLFAQEGCKELTTSWNVPQHNISKCDRSCCDWSDLCNVQLSRPSFESLSDGKTRCVKGKKTVLGNGSVVDDTRAITCPRNPKGTGSETSCLKAKLTTDKQEQHWYSMCYPTAICDAFTCDVMIDAMPKNLKDTVTSCSTSCCRGDLCNRASHVANPSLLLLIIIAALLVLR